MKRILIALALLLPLSSLAQDRYDIPQTGTKIGLTRTGINSNFVFLFIAGTNSFRTAVEKGSNINFVAKSPTNATQLDYCLTNMTSDGNTPQGPWTNWIAGATWGVSNAGTYGFADTNTILFTLGTNSLVIQGGATTPTNLAWNGFSLINSFVEANTPTNAFLPTTLVAGAGYTATVTRTGANLFYIMATSTPLTINLDSGALNTGVVFSSLLSIEAGTNTIAFSAAFTNSGRACWTNTSILTAGTTDLLIHKPIGRALANVIQLVP